MELQTCMHAPLELLHEKISEFPGPGVSVINMQKLNFKLLCRSAAGPVCDFTFCGWSALSAGEMKVGLG